MTHLPLKILLVQTFYPEFLDELYRDDPGLGDTDFEVQSQRVFATAFGVGDAYSHGLGQLGCEAMEVICNADILQGRWAREHALSLTGNIHDRRRQILAAQIDHYKPDVLYVFEWSPLGDAFLHQVKPIVRLLVGQIASPLPADRSFAAYDLMISSYPPIVDYFNGHGLRAALLGLGFDERIRKRLADAPPKYDVTFVGGFAPSHADRIPWLESILREVDVAVFGYGIERVPASSPIHAHHRGSAWGWEMYEILQRSRVTLNRHARIDIHGQVVTSFANNMRLYEATGVETCLMTENQDNLCQLFEPGREVVTYDNPTDCVKKIIHYREHETERLAIARTGGRRTHRDHRYTSRMAELLELIRQRLHQTNGSIIHFATESVRKGGSIRST